MAIVNTSNPDLFFADMPIELDEARAITGCTMTLFERTAYTAPRRPEAIDFPALGRTGLDDALADFVR